LTGLDARGRMCLLTTVLQRLTVLQFIRSCCFSEASCARMRLGMFHQRSKAAGLPELRARAQAPLDGVTAAFYNAFFTSLPIGAFALFDRPVRHLATLLAAPQAYNRKPPITTRAFWKTGIFTAIVHASVRAARAGPRAPGAAAAPAALGCSVLGSSRGQAFAVVVRAARPAWCTVQRCEGFQGMLSAPLHAPAQAAPAR